MKAIHGGKAKHDQVDAPKSAVFRRGGRLPQAAAEPAERRATRDLLRRRHRMRQRAARLAPVQQTNRQSNLPELSKKLAYQASRAGVAARFPAPAVPKRIEVDRARSDTDDRLLTDLGLDRVQTAKMHDAQTFYRLRSIPGVGKRLALVLRYELHAIHRFPRGQAFVADSRRVKCAKEPAGTRDGASGKTIGTAALTWAVSEAAVLCLRHHPAGQQSLTRVERTHGKGKALPIPAHQVARAV